METKSEGKLQAGLSKGLKKVEADIFNEQQKEMVDYQVLKGRVENPKRKLGILEGKMIVTFNHDFNMTMEEFLGL